MRCGGRRSKLIIGGDGGVVSQTLQAELLVVPSTNPFLQASLFPNLFTSFRAFVMVLVGVGGIGESTS